MEVQNAAPEVAQELQEVVEKLENVKLSAEEEPTGSQTTEDKSKRGSLSKFFRMKATKSSSAEDVTAASVPKSNTLTRLFAKKDKPKNGVAVNIEAVSSKPNLTSPSVTDLSAGSGSKTNKLMRIFAKKEKPLGGEIEIGYARRSFVRGLVNCQVVPWISRQPSRANIHHSVDLVSTDKDDEDDETPQETVKHREIF